MREANKMSAAYALFVGQDEIQNQVFGLKNLVTSEQDFLSIQQIIERLEPFSESSQKTSDE